MDGFRDGGFPEGGRAMRVAARVEVDAGALVRPAGTAALARYRPVASPRFVAWGRDGGGMVIDDHPTAIGETIREAEARGGGGGLAVFGVRERVGAGVDGGVTEHADVLFAEPYPGVGARGHVAEIFA